MLILGTQCDANKALALSIQRIFGVNGLTSLQICALIGANAKAKLKKLKPARLEKLKRVCRDELGLNLFRQTKLNVKGLIEIKHYKGIRHMFGLPVRGQRSRTNASNAKKLAFIKQKTQNQKKQPKRRR